MKPDSQLQRDVLDELMFEPSVNHSHIGSGARDGVDLRIAGEKRDKIEEKDERSVVSECSYGTSDRRIRLPEAADAGRTVAKSKHGILEITIPKDEDAQPARRKITVERD